MSPYVHIYYYYEEEGLVTVVLILLTFLHKVHSAPRTLRQAASGEITVSASNNNNFMEAERQSILKAGSDFINTNKDAANSTMHALVSLVDAGVKIFGSFPTAIFQAFG